MVLRPDSEKKGTTLIHLLLRSPSGRNDKILLPSSSSSYQPPDLSGWANVSLRPVLSVFESMSAAVCPLKSETSVSLSLVLTGKSQCQPQSAPPK